MVFIVWNPGRRWKIYSKCRPDPKLWKMEKSIIKTVFIFFFSIFCLFRATPTACGGSQARELQLLAYATTTARQDPSRVCDPHHSSQQRRILNPLSEARDQTRNVMVPSRICFYGNTMGTPGPCSLCWCCFRKVFSQLFGAGGGGPWPHRGRVVMINEKRDTYTDSTPYPCLVVSSGHVSHLQIFSSP